MPTPLKDALQPPANGWNNQSAWNPAVDTVADILRECEASGLLEDLRAGLGCTGEDHHVVTLRAIRDLVYELAGSENRDLAVTVKSDDRQAQILDAMGNASPIASAQDSKMTATVYPTTLLLEGATKVEIAP